LDATAWHVNPARLVFIDETCTSSAMMRLRDRSLRGEHLIGSRTDIGRPSHLGRLWRERDDDAFRA
jgi:hypothetical protein